MMVQITIIGLGQIGASIGLALAGKGDVLRRVGHDREYGIARQAEKQGAVDKINANLPSSVAEADLVLLCIPTDQVRETLELIAQDLKEGAVVMDTGPGKEVVSGWAAEVLPEGRYYVGLMPVLNPAYLHVVDTGLQAARADLFQKGLMAIASPPHTESGAIKLAADLTRLLGAMPLFADPVEVDGLVAATHLLPQLLAAGLVNATVDQPGWREGRKLAGRAYAEASGPIVHLGGGKALSAAVMANRENILRSLDGAIAALGAIRNDIEADDLEALQARLERAQAAREKWYAGRRSGEWMSDGAPTIEFAENPGTIGRLFGIGRKPKGKK